DDVHGRVPDGRCRAPARPSARGGVPPAGGRARGGRGRRALRALGRRHVLDGRRLHPLVPEHLGPPRPLRRDAGPAAAVGSRLPVRSGLGLPGDAARASRGGARASWLMLRAAIVGLGWWGKTLVESAAGSDALRFVAGVSRSATPETLAFAEQNGLRLAADLDTALGDAQVDAVVLATPHSLHAKQVIAAARAGKHVFCEKPFALERGDAESAIEAVRQAGVTIGLGYNRRFHPEITSLRERIRTGALGTVLHVEATMTFANALFLKPEQWRASREETPCGGLTPMGVHAIDVMIDLCGEVDHVYCQSFRRAVEIDADDTTSILLRMKDGMSGYLGTMTATGPGFSFQVFGSNGSVRLEGMT